MSVWILGSHGMLGHAFFRYFHDLDIPVKATSKQDLDITDPQAVMDFAKEHNFKYWINCAAYTYVDRAEAEQENAYKVNVNGINNLIHAAKSCSQEGYQVKLIHFSTDYVFDGLTNHSYSEEDKTRPLSVYGSTKLESENLLLAKYPNSLIFRLSWLFGAHGHNFLKTILEKMKQQEVIYVVDDQTGCPTFACDIPKWVWQLREETGLFHLCNSEPTSWHGFAQEISHQAHLLGYDLHVKLIEAVDSTEYPTAARRPRFSVLDTKKAQELGVEFRPWQEALNDCLKELQHGES